MELDEGLIQTRIDIIERNLNEAEKIVSQPELTYRDELALKHALLESIEACLDISNHIIAAKNFRKPESYSDTFKILEENGIISKELSEKLQNMAKFRNVLVHKYAIVNVERIKEICKKDVEDIKIFIREVLKFIKSENR